MALAAERFGVRTGSLAGQADFVLGLYPHRHHTDGAGWRQPTCQLSFAGPVPGLGVPRESTWVLRTITGAAFGWATAWLVFPHLQAAFAEIGENSIERLAPPAPVEVLSPDRRN